MIFSVRDPGERYDVQAYYPEIVKKFQKLAQNSAFEPIQYFDIENDEGEISDLSSQRKPENRDLRAKLLEHIQKAGAVPWQKAKSE